MHARDFFTWRGRVDTSLTFYPAACKSQRKPMEAACKSQRKPMEAADVMASSSSPRTDLGWPGVADFYAHKDVFITGATGFMGKCLVEKLLRSVPELGRLFLLVRPKRGKPVKDRIDDMLRCKLFDTLRSKQPAVFDKVVPVAGDIMEPDMGLSEEDTQLLIENVAVVFHLAATIRFDEPIRDALQMNVVGVRKVIKLCKMMKKLVSFVHVSTAFAHCNRQDRIEEIIYPPPVHPDKILSLLEWMSDEQLESITPSLLDGRPNTYTYTKALAEYVLINEAKGLPVSIFRPSIVGAGYREPLPGWVDTLHGAGAILVPIGKGMLRVCRYSKFWVADFVPVDLVNNMLICVGWLTGVNPSPQPIVYHYSSGTLNPITWSDLYPLVISSYTKNPFDQIFGQPHVFKCRPASAWPWWHFLMHIIPGFLADILLRLVGKKPIMLHLYNKMGKAIGQLDYFTQNDWKWSHANHDKLLSIMSEEDKQEFDFDIRSLDWDQYIHDFCMGTKQYLFKEDLANLPVARRQIKRLRNIRYTFNIMVFLVIWSLLYFKSRIARDIWNTLITLCLHSLVKLGTPLLHHSNT